MLPCCAHAARELRRTARSANKKGGRDGTTYSRVYQTPFLAHHMRAISGAAVFSDAAHIENGIRYLAHLTTKIGAAPRAESPATTDSDSE